jgi:RNA polymerase sigma factor (sigma-70 family)
MLIYFTHFAAQILVLFGGLKNFFKFFSQKVAKIAFSNGVIIEGYLLLNFLSARKGGKSMNSPNHEEHIQHTFDSYCKKILKGVAIDIQRENIRRSKHEINFSEMHVQEFLRLSATDDYFADEFIFSVLGESVGVSNPILAEALNGLSTHRREIVLMSYFFDMTDKEIAERLKMARRTVAYQRTSTLRQLKNFIESEETK